MDFTKPFDDADAEGLAQVLAAFHGTLPESLSIVRRDIAASPEGRDRAIAAMHTWKNGK